MARTKHLAPPNRLADSLNRGRRGPALRRSKAEGNTARIIEKVYTVPRRSIAAPGPDDLDDSAVAPQRDRDVIAQAADTVFAPFVRSDGNVSTPASASRLPKPINHRDVEARHSTSWREEIVDRSNRSGESEPARRRRCCRRRRPEPDTPSGVDSTHATSRSSAHQAWGSRYRPGDPRITIRVPRRPKGT